MRNDLQATIDRLQESYKRMTIFGCLDDDDARYMDALATALTALRDMLKRREGCDFCNESVQIQNQYGDIMEMDDGVLILDTEGYPGVTFRIKYCPDCGRKLEDEK